jgi:phenylalanine-4-hydroxylase
LQIQLDTNIDKELLKNYSLDIGLFLSTSNNINYAKKYDLLKKIHGHHPKITNSSLKNKGG